jgi:hypothetical protein
VIKALGDLAWRDHKSALWWLGLLYRRPQRFREELEQLSRRRTLWAGLLVLAHALPYVLTIDLFGWFVFEGLDDPLRRAVAGDAFALLVHAAALLKDILFLIVFAIVLVIVTGVAYGIAPVITRGIAFGISSGTAGGIAGGITAGTIFAGEIGVVAIGIVNGIAGGIAAGMATGIATRIAGGIAFGIAFGIFAAMVAGSFEEAAKGIPIGSALGIATRIFEGLASGIVVGTAMGVAYLRAYYEPVHLWFVWPALQARWYRFHPVAWDDLCSLPFPGLHRLLLAYARISPEAGNAEIERLISGYPSQRMEALRARVALLAREAGTQRDLARLDAIIASLPEGDKGFLAQTSQVRQMVGAIAAQQRQLDTIDRAVLRQPYASLLVKEIDSFRGRVGGFREPLASEFRAAADNWLAIAQRQLSEIRSVLGKEPTPQVFRAGDPVDRAQEAFVPRMSVVGQLERQVMLASGCPGVLIYGRRRTGKSTLLRNLDGFLPGSVRIIAISMQNPAAFTSFLRYVV